MVGRKGWKVEVVLAVVLVLGEGLWAGLWEVPAASSLLPYVLLWVVLCKLPHGSDYSYYCSCFLLSKVVGAHLRRYSSLPVHYSLAAPC